MWWGRGQGVQDQLSTFDAESKSAISPNSLYGGTWGGGGGIWDQVPTFDALSKSAKIGKSLHREKGSKTTSNF